MFDFLGSESSVLFVTEAVTRATIIRLVHYSSTTIRLVIPMKQLDKDVVKPLEGMTLTQCDTYKPDSCCVSDHLTCSETVREHDTDTY
jgi:hypothetical protein